MAFISGRIGDSAGAPATGRVEFTQAQRLDTGEMLITQAVSTAQVVGGELRTLSGLPFSLPTNPEGSAVRVREMFGGRTFEWYTAVPNVETIEYRALPLIQSSSRPDSVFGPPAWISNVEQMRDETITKIDQGTAAADALGGVAGLEAVAQRAEAAEETAASAATRAEAAAGSIDVEQINQRISDIGGEITSRAEDRNTGLVVDPAGYGVPVDGVSNAGPSLNTLIASLPAGSRIQARPGQVFNIGTSVQVSKEITIQGGTWLHQASVTSFIVNADGVTFDGLTIIGPTLGTTTPTASRFIYVNGTSSKLIDRLTVRQCVLTNSHHTAIRMNWCSNFLIDGNTITNVQYAAIMMDSPKVGTVRDNTIRNVVQAGTLINSYGIAASDGLNIASARAEDVLIIGNYVEGVLGWEGIDTHGGKGIKVIGNSLRSCRYPIAMVVGNSDRALAPQACVVSDNFIERGSAPDEAAAVNYVGLNAGLLCDGMIGANSVRGYSRDVRVAFSDSAKMTVLPQSSDASSPYAPDAPAFRMYMQEFQLTIPANSKTATNRALSFPSGRFKDVPKIVATPSQNSAPGFTPHTYSQTATGFNLGGSAEVTSASSRTITVVVLAIQMDSGTGLIPGF